MQRIVIQASDAGFFNLSPLGDPLAPNVFLKTAVNIAGLIESTDQGWQSRESGMYAGFGVEVRVTTDLPLDTKLGLQSPIDVTDVVFFRIENDQKSVTGTLHFPAPVTITATYDQLGVDRFGWRADLGTPITNMVRADGFLFNGGTGDDVFAPHTTILPTYGTSVLHGYEGNDQLTGSLGNDVIWGGSGDDTLFDPDGVNRILAGSGDDFARLGDGSDGGIIRGGTGNDTLVSGAGNDRLIGNAGRDVLQGGAGNDVLDGLLGRDTLDGGRGADVVNGGKGNDVLTGGEGGDRFVFDATQNGRDTITDFTPAEDILVFSGIAGPDTLTIVQTGVDTVIDWGVDGANITLQNTETASLGADDFLFL